MDINIIGKYFPNLSPSQSDQFRLFGKLLIDWNEKVNLISRKDTEHFFERHVLHSLSIAKYYTFQPGQQIMDLGTGGGFPGIPLAVLFPDTQFDLIDSIGKKINVVQDVILQLDLKNATAQVSRAEQVKKSYDLVVTRAVAPASDLWKWTHQKIKNTGQGGIIALKGGDLKTELAELKRPHQVMALSKYFDEPFFETKKIVFIPR